MKITTLIPKTKFFTNSKFIASIIGVLIFSLNSCTKENTNLQSDTKADQILLPSSSNSQYTLTFVVPKEGTVKAYSDAARTIEITTFPIKADKDSNTKIYLAFSTLANFEVIDALGVDNASLDTAQKIATVTMDSSKTVTIVTKSKIFGVSNDGTQILGYRGESNTINVPASINNVQITSIGYRGLALNPKVTDVILPNGITTIGKLAFEDNFNLANVQLPSTITTIADSAFAYCNRITNFVIYSTTPPTLGKDVFIRSKNTIIPFSLNIQVPSASLNAYKTAPGWSEFASQITGF